MPLQPFASLKKYFPASHGHASLLIFALLSCAAPSHAAPSEIAGELEVLVEDHPDRSVTRHFLKSDKARFELKFKGKAPELASGAKVRVKGEQADAATPVLMLSNLNSVQTAAPATAASASGAQQTVVLLVNFKDDTSQPYSIAQANDVVFNQVNSFMRENSFQQTSVTGQTYGWLTLPITKTCVGSDIAAAAKQAAAGAQIDLKPFSRFIYVFPLNTACFWTGMATVGGAPSDIWVNGSLKLHTIGHELGHNFGLRHSHSSDCGATVLATSCTTTDYGDIADIMGNVFPAHFNAFQKQSLGWLNAGSQPAIITVQETGNYVIDAYSAAAGTNAKALKILKSVDATTGLKTWYYIEYRQAIGFDGALSGVYNGNLLGGVLVRTGAEGNASSSYLLDMTPDSYLRFPISDAGLDLNDAALPVGQTYTDAAAGLTITASAANGANATVSITLASAPSPTPTPSPPPPTASVLATTVVTDQIVYAVGNRVTATASVIADGKPVGNANVTIVFTKPNGTTVVQTAVTNASGVAMASYRISRKDPSGAWKASDNASYAGLTASAASTFSVK